MAVDDDAPERRVSEPQTSPDDPTGPPAGAPPRLLDAAVFASVAVLAFGGLAGWLGFRTYESHRAEVQREQFLRAAQQGALNLTTIDHEHAEADVQRVLDSATGTFYEDFSNRSQPFIEIVKTAQAKSVGTVTEAGIEQQTADEAQVLVAVSVNTTNAGAAEQLPRAWRMRISVTRVDGQEKVSNVAFVP
ncbi:mammalian cell entry protein [Mycolicibacter sinensis]|jgi:Mce-associated membrane protein|uniref:mammalian cell entry protein n=1 Tax=Mycolicibacter sinensis (strain JDM601) TaxID=875328 RepID=UPI000D68D764|nr:mammalian cell entry protein [Mycolicibacter sinensis]